VGSALAHPAIRARRAGQPMERPVPPMRRSILAPTTAVLLVARPAREGFGSSMRSPASSGWVREWVASGRLGEAAIERAIEALSICRDKMLNRGAARAA